MRVRLPLSLLLGLVVCGGAVFTAQVQNLDEATCPVSGQPIDEEQTAQWHSSTLYFCCPNCPGAFSEHPDQFAAKANYQIVLTGQVEQTACPVSGQECDAEQTLQVGGVTVCFCCENCKGAAEEAEGEEQLEMLFGAEAFEKGFDTGSE